MIEEPGVCTRGLDARDWLAAYERMLEIRRFEELAERLFYTGDIRGSTHLAIGQEAIPVGARLALAEGDLVAPTY